MKECVAQEHKDTIKAFKYIVFGFIGSVWFFLSTVFFLLFGAVGFLPFGIGGVMFVCFFAFMYPEYRDSKRSLKVLSDSLVVTESVTCIKKIHLSSSECLDSEESDEYYMGYDDNRYYQLDSTYFDSFAEGDKFLLAGVFSEKYVVAFICEKTEEGNDGSYVQS